MTQEQAKMYNVYVFSPSGIVVEKTYNMLKIQAIKKQFFGLDIERVDPKACLVDDAKYQKIIMNCDIYVDEEGLLKDLEKNKMVSVVQKDTGGKFVCISSQKELEAYQRLPTIVTPLVGYVIAVSKKPVA
jgi:hypothetical protein